MPKEYGKAQNNFIISFITKCLNTDNLFLILSFQLTYLEFNNEKNHDWLACFFFTTLYYLS